MLYQVPEKKDYLQMVKSCFKKTFEYNLRLYFSKIAFCWQIVLWKLMATMCELVILKVLMLVEQVTLCICLFKKANLLN